VSVNADKGGHAEVANLDSGGQPLLLSTHEHICVAGWGQNGVSNQKLGYGRMWVGDRTYWPA
jgi:hypothetical protein